jgi:hypothetical protein
MESRGGGDTSREQFKNILNYLAVIIKDLNLSLLFGYTEIEDLEKLKKYLQINLVKKKLGEENISILLNEIISNIETILNRTRLDLILKNKHDELLSKYNFLKQEHAKLKAQLEELTAATAADPKEETAADPKEETAAAATDPTTETGGGKKRKSKKHKKKRNRKTKKYRK